MGVRHVAQRASIGTFALVCVGGLGVWLSVGGLQAAQQSSAAPATDETARAVLDKYCVTCHNATRHTAGIDLDKLAVEHVGTDAKTWEKVVQKLRSRDMPPKGMPRPDAATYDKLTGYLETSLDAEAVAHPNPGRVPVHRLNRVEYVNAIRDLLALEVDARKLLPADDRDQDGFDNIASVLSVSPVLTERYLAAARAISRQAVGDPTILPGAETYTVHRFADQDQWMGEDMPLGSRGGTAIRHHFPLAGEYVVKVLLRRQLYGYLIGMGFPHQLEVRLDGAPVRRLNVGGEGQGKSAPETFVGALIGDGSWETYMQQGDANLEARFPVPAGTHLIQVHFVDSDVEEEGVAEPPQTDFNASIHSHYDGLPAVLSVAITGPYSAAGPGDTPSRQRIFSCRPSNSAAEEPCARQILSTLARRAYRRPVSDGDVGTLLTFYRRGRSATGTFEAGIQRAIERMLADPNFLFRIERDPKNAPAVHRLTDIELASRLSFFLWSSIPDDELLDIAAAGKLQDSGMLRRQVRRMLANTKSTALVENFASAWLRVRELSGVNPDPHLFTDFNENLREAFRRETELFVASQLREDRSVVDLLTANYTFVNEQLARHYGIPGVYGGHFRRVALTDERRFGLLGHGSILTVTAYPDRTSPVLRGKWLLDNVFGAPPPPPPDDVPALSEGEDVQQLSMRERMEEHRKNPVCASCHTKMDPMGFALENFDAIGRWRDITSGGVPIDSTAVMPDGTQVQGVAGLRRLLLNHRSEFVNTIESKLLTYALGRTVEYYDMPALRQIKRETATQDDRWSAVILAIVESSPFQMRRTQE